VREIHPRHPAPAELTLQPVAVGESGLEFCGEAGHATKIAGLMAGNKARRSPSSRRRPARDWFYWQTPFQIFTVAGCPAVRVLGQLA
jgi:hypothetical protein